MEQNFQTSFIPKKPIVEERAKPKASIGFFTVISIFIFLTMVLVLGGLYFYKQVLTKSIVTMENNLNLAKNRFEPAKINQLQSLDKRLKASEQVLNKHIVVSPIFKVLQDITLKTVRYTRFSYDLGGGNGDKVSIKLGGLAIGYRSVALQADLFTKNKTLIDPVFSNLSLDEKGNVLFDLEFFVDPSFVSYRQTLQRESGSNDDSLENANSFDGTSPADVTNTTPAPNPLMPDILPTNTNPGSGSGAMNESVPTITNNKNGI